jgi:hypothetical protein
MGSLVVVMIILGCGAYQYFKGTIFKAVSAIIITVCASAVAFGYFEILAAYFTKEGSASKYPAIVPYAQPLCFALLFILTFAVLQTLASQLTRLPVDFGLMPERIGRPILGVFLGLILSGLLLTGLAMAPLPNKYPYQRFEGTFTAASAQNPSRVLLNADGLICGWFGLLSKGSFAAIREPRSFATLHPAFIDQLFLNRQNESPDIPLITSSDSIEVPNKNGAWYAPAAGVKDADGKPIAAQAGHALVVVRMGILKNTINDSGRFTPGQLRLICKQKDAPGDPLTGTGRNVYPIGYFSAADRITTKRLTEPITIDRSDYVGQDTRRYVDYVFNVPNDFVPVLLEFKQNCIVNLPRIVSAEQAPPPAPFIERARTGPDAAKPGDSPDAGAPGNPPPGQDASSDRPKRRGGLSPAGRMLTGGAVDDTE